MLTSRGYWILLAATTLTAGSLLVSQFGITLLGLAVLLWLGVQWAAFAFRVAGADRRFIITRRLNGQPIGHGMLWAGIPAKVDLELVTTHWLPLAEVTVSDRVPLFGWSATEPNESRPPHQTRGPWTRQQPLTISYSLTPEQPGRLRFEGVRIEIVDRMGCFQFRVFVRDPFEVRVLPPLSLSGEHDAVHKRLNLLPARGIHRFRGPGTSSELLDLRDYQPGDPPKTIAWKISARRDRLITKQFESEVPVRCTLLLDGSSSMRLGTRSTPLLQGARIVAGLARSLLAQNDPVGLIVFSEKGSSVVTAALGRRQVIRILARLAEVLSTPLSPSPCPSEHLLQPAWVFCEQVYPDLLDSSVNRGPRLVDRLLGWLRRPSLVAMLIAGALGAAILAIGLWSMGLAILLAGTASVVVAGLLSLASLFGLAKPRAPRSSPRLRQVPAKRKRLASLLATIQGQSAAAIARMLADDAYFSVQLQRFLIKHQVPFRRSLFGQDGRYLFADAGKLQVLARCLLRAVAHGRDNELFVILVDLLELRSGWDELLRAVKVAVSRHHQVVVLCPWPEGLPPIEAMAEHTRLAYFAQEAMERDLATLDRLRHRSAYLDLQSQLRRLRVPLLATTADEAIADTLRRVEQIRAARTMPGRVAP